jgi:TROVE domain
MESDRPGGLIEGSGMQGEPTELHAPARRLTSAEQWQLMIPQMGYMALIRNLRNFDKAGIPESVANKIAQRIADPAQVARSRQLPFRFYSAYINAPSLRWGYALEQALQACLPNVPELPGRTLILIDTSGSMESFLSERPDSRPRRGKGRRGGSPDEPPPVRPKRVQAAALFGLALALKNPETVDVWGFADGQFRVTGIGPGQSLLRAVEAFSRCIGNAGHGTQIALAARMCYGAHDRVCIFTDMQTFAESPGFALRWGGWNGPGGVGDVSSAVPARVPVYAFNLAGYEASAMPVGGGWNGPGGVGDVSSAVPARVPVYAFNLAGYEASAMPVGGGNRHELGGLSDATFRMIPVIEAGRSARWPWEEEAA